MYSKTTALLFCHEHVNRRETETELGVFQALTVKYLLLLCLSGRDLDWGWLADIALTTRTGRVN